MIDNSFIQNLNWKNYGTRLNNFLSEIEKNNDKNSNFVWWFRHKNERRN